MLLSAVVLVPVMGVILFLIGSSEVPGVDDIDLKEAFVLNLAKVAVWAQLRSQVRGSSSSSRAPFRSRPAWGEARKLRPSGPLPAPGRAVHVVVTSKTPGLVALAARPQAGCLTAWCLSLPVCKMGIIMVPVPWHRERGEA